MQHEKWFEWSIKSEMKRNTLYYRYIRFVHRIIIIMTLISMERFVNFLWMSKNLHPMRINDISTYFSFNKLYWRMYELTSFVCFYMRESLAMRHLLALQSIKCWLKFNILWISIDFHDLCFVTTRFVILITLHSKLVFVMRFFLFSINKVVLICWNKKLPDVNFFFIQSNFMQDSRQSRGKNIVDHQTKCACNDTKSYDLYFCVVDSKELSKTKAKTIFLSIYTITLTFDSVISRNFNRRQFKWAISN